MAVKLHSIGRKWSFYFSCSRFHITHAS